MYLAVCMRTAWQLCLANVHCADCNNSGIALRRHSLSHDTFWGVSMGWQ